jgi:Ca2+-binding EF-hand superfamily protein
MGNGPASKMGLQSIALTTPNLEKPEIEFMLAEMRSYSESSGSDAIPRSIFDEILAKIEKFDDSDTQLCNNLFILFDEKGDKTVQYKDFIAGTMSCTSEKTASKLKFSLGLYDVEKVGFIMRSDLRKMLKAINNVASYFGDPVLKVSEIMGLEVALFKSLKNATGRGIPLDIALEYVLSDPLIQGFLNGEGTVRFGSPELNPA